MSIIVKEAPLLIRSVAELNMWLAPARSSQQSVGFVPTMGALHEGHLALVKKARLENDVLCVSIFVNPKQFGANEDLGTYPRTLERDHELLKEQKVDLLFAPNLSDIYDEQFSFKVSEESELSQVCCGKYRPGFYDGICTVLLKLFQLIKPHKAYFGLKDLQQYLIVKKMVKDFSLDLEIIGHPTIRENSGLALSSRNKYLNLSEKKIAAQIFTALEAAKNLYLDGERNRDKIIERAKEILDATEIKTQYLEIRQLPNLQETHDEIFGELAILYAGFLSKTRLIDNLILSA